MLACLSTARNPGVTLIHIARDGSAIPAAVAPPPSPASGRTPPLPPVPDAHIPPALQQFFEV